MGRDLTCVENMWVIPHITMKIPTSIFIFSGALFPSFAFKPVMTQYIHLKFPCPRISGNNACPFTMTQLGTLASDLLGPGCEMSRSLLPWLWQTLSINLRAHLFQGWVEPTDHSHYSILVCTNHLKFLNMRWGLFDTTLVSGRANVLLTKT